MLEKDPKSLKEDFEDMEQSVQDLLKFVNNILDLAKLQAGRVEFAVEPVDGPPGPRCGNAAATIWLRSVEGAPARRGDE